MPEEQKTLYIFIDESGNFDFSPNGTKYFALTAVSTLRPLKSRGSFLQKVYEIKYKGWTNGQQDYCFHATEDQQEVRDWMFGMIEKLDDIEIDAIIAQKNKTNPSLYINYERKGTRYLPVHSEELFYDKVSQMLLKYIFKRHEEKDHIEKIVVVLGSLFTDTKRGYVLKSLKRFLKANFQKPFYIYFRPTPSDINCQIADYCGWAVYVRQERGEERPWAKIQPKIKSHFDVFARGQNEYYQYKT